MCNMIHICDTTQRPDRWRRAPRQVSLCVCVCVSVCVYVRVHVCVCVRVHVCTYMYTYIRVNPNLALRGY